MDKDKSQTSQSQSSPDNLNGKFQVVTSKDVLPVSQTSGLSEAMTVIPAQTGGDNIKKRKKNLLKDENAPKAPLTGYLRFINKHRETVRVQQPNMPFHETTKLLGTMWTELPQEHKQVYLDEAEKAKEKYMEALAKYQQTDSYKSFVAQQEATKKVKLTPNPASRNNSLFCIPCNKQFFSVHNKNEHLAGRKHRSIVEKMARSGQYVPKVKQLEPTVLVEVKQPAPAIMTGVKRAEPTVVATNAPSENLPSPKPVTQTLADMATVENNLDIPVFSQQFLDYNKSRESELRKLKKATNECEEQNAILNKHNDNLKSAITKLEDEGKRYREELKNLEPFLKQLNSVLAQRFSDVLPPVPDRAPNEDPRSDFVKQFYTLSQNLVNDSDAVVKVKKIISELDYPNCFNDVKS